MSILGEKEIFSGLRHDFNPDFQAFSTKKADLKNINLF